MLSCIQYLWTIAIYIYFYKDFEEEGNIKLCAIKQWHNATIFFMHLTPGYGGRGVHSPISVVSSPPPPPPITLIVPRHTAIIIYTPILWHTPTHSPTILRLVL